MPLEGGLAHNPDQVLIYAKPDDTEKGKDHGGTISFSFKLKVCLFLCFLFVVMSLFIRIKYLC